MLLFKGVFIDFLKRYLMQSMDVFNDSVDLLISKLSAVADGKTEVKMLDLFNRITLDAVAKVKTNFLVSCI